VSRAQSKRSRGPASHFGAGSVFRPVVIEHPTNTHTMSQSANVPAGPDDHTPAHNNNPTSQPESPLKYPYPVPSLSSTRVFRDLPNLPEIKALADLRAEKAAGDPFDNDAAMAAMATRTTLWELNGMH
jgi:hypothetical protein